MNAAQHIEAHSPPAPAGAATLFAYEVLDDDAVAALDPILARAGIIRLEAPWTEPTIIHAGGVDILRLDPTESGQPYRDLCAELYAAIVSARGDDGVPDPSPRWLEEGAAWAGDALRRVPEGPMESWRGEAGALRAQVADRLLRSFALPREDVEAIVGSRVKTTRGLWPISGDAARLDERQRAADEAEARAQALAAVVAAEEARPKMLGELGLTVVEVRRDRVGGTIGTRGGMALVPPWEFARALWTTDEAVYFGFRSVPGLELPMFSADGIRALASDEIVPRPHATALDPDRSAILWLVAARKRFGSALDLGPISADRLSSKGLERAKEIAAAHARFLIAPPTFDTGWRTEWLAHACTRGCLLRPDVAAKVLLEARDHASGVFVHERWRNEAPRLDWASHPIVGQCVTAVQSGIVSAGALLEAPAPSKSKRARSST